MPIDYLTGAQALKNAANTDKPSAGQSFYPIYTLKKGEPVKGWFVTRYDENLDSDFLVYSEISTFDGMKDGRQAPNGLKEIPVNGYKDSLVSRVNRGRLDIDDEGNPIAARPKAKMMFNFVTDEGKHILLKVTKPKGLELLAKFVDEDDNLEEGFDWLSMPFTLSLKGEKGDQRLSVKPHRDENPIDLPEPYDCRKVINELRDKFDAWDTGFEASEEADVVQDEVDDYIAPDPENMYDVYMNCTKARLRTKLRLQHPDFDLTGLGHEELAELAVSVGLILT